MTKRKEYKIITIAGRVNVGKSSLLNLLSGQDDFVIVDATPGTTSDTVMSRMEIHGLGPIKVLDTAGLDEESKLGEKKRKKTENAIEESDLVLLMVDIRADKSCKDFEIERTVIKRAKKYQKQVLVLFNIFEDLSSREIESFKNHFFDKLGDELPSCCLNVLNSKEQRQLVEFIKNNFITETREIDLLPLTQERGFVLLVIPMDEETPTLRLLRPQDMAIERILRKFMVPVIYRMDLKKARKGNDDEKQRYLSMVEYLKSSLEGLNLVITDSQAMDIVDGWTSQDVKLTTFSVMMASYMSCGNLDLLAKGLDNFSSLKNGDKILIIESCNHDRKCDDIGTKQIPRLIKEKLKLDLKIEFSFGRVMPDNLNDYKLAIHCGGCMADRQKYGRRIIKLKEVGIPVTNYGLFLSWVHNPEAVKRVKEVFN